MATGCAQIFQLKPEDTMTGPIGIHIDKAGIYELCNDLVYTPDSGGVRLSLMHLM